MPARSLLPCARLISTGLLLASTASPATAEVPFDGWRGQRSTPAFAGAGDRRPLDNSSRYGQPYVAPREVRPLAQGRPELWTGFYAGGHAGGGWGHATPNGTSGDDISLDGFVGGLHGGYNQQFGVFVIGAEVDASLSSIDGSRFYGGSGIAANVSHDWTASLRGRLGYAWDNWLFYGTAGVAGAGVGLDVMTSDQSSARDRVSGFVWGGGVEMKINPQMSIRVEALRYNFGDVTLGSVAGPVTLGNDFTAVRAGLSWHF